jgi:glutaredoxin 3
MTVKIYSTPSCMYCNMAKDYFTEHGVAYEEINVAVDIEKRKEMVEKSGQLGVPVIEIGDKVVVGFDEEEIAHLLGAQGGDTASIEDTAASDASSATE